MKPLTDKDGEVRELSAEDFREMKPVRDVMPELVGAMAEFRKKLGRPKIAEPKVHIGFRLAPDVVESIRASGPGYNARVERVLREAFVVRSDPVESVQPSDPGDSARVVPREGFIVRSERDGLVVKRKSEGVTTLTDTVAAKGKKHKPKPRRWA